MLVNIYIYIYLGEISDKKYILLGTLKHWRTNSLFTLCVCARARAYKLQGIMMLFAKYRKVLGANSNLSQLFDALGRFSFVVTASL